jgi:hypothetical protein
VSWLDSYVFEFVLSYFKFGQYHLLDVSWMRYNFSGSVVGFVFVVVVFETIFSRKIVSFLLYGIEPMPLTSAALSGKCHRGTVIIHIVRFLQRDSVDIGRFPPGDICMENPFLLPAYLAQR